jgi:hypothetical protein
MQNYRIIYIQKLYSICHEISSGKYEKLFGKYVLHSMQNKSVIKYDLHIRIYMQLLHP